VLKAVTVELRWWAAGSPNPGVGRRVAMKVLLQDVAVRGPPPFSVHRSGTVHAFEGPVAAGRFGPLTRDPCRAPAGD
jgi:hypothetical protein